ncbi:MAG: hypothetical protein ABWK00_07125 [Desulfurococcaceae archaeon]
MRSEGEEEKYMLAVLPPELAEEELELLMPALLPAGGDEPQGEEGRVTL